MKNSISINNLPTIKKAEPSRLFVFLFLTCVIGLLSYTLFRHEYLPGDDWAYHLARIEGIKDGLLLGEFPVKIHAYLLNGYGYGNGFFYPNFFLYIPGLFRILGNDLIFSYKLFFLLIIIVTSFSAYLCAQYILQDRYAALCAAVLYAVSHTIVSNIYWRSALGETIAAVFLPIVICGVYNLIHENFTKPWIIILGFSGLMSCHMISLAIALFYTFAVVAVNFRKFLKHDQNTEEPNVKSGGKILLALLLSAVVVLLITMNFWLPMMEQMASDKFEYSQSNIYVSDNVLGLSDLFIFSKASLGLPLAAFTGIALLFRILNFFLKKSIKLLQYDYFLFTGIIFSLATTKMFPWKFFGPILDPIQFPWRLLTLSSFFLALGIAGIFSQSFKKAESRVFVLLIICIITSVFCVSMINIRWAVFHTDVPTDVYGDTKSTGVGEEWLPVNTDTSLLTNPTIVHAENTADVTASKQGTTVSFESEAGNGYYDVPLIFYKGYSAQIVKQDGIIEDLSVTKSANNLVRVLNPEKISGMITASYSGTLIEKISYATSILTLMMILIFIFLKTRKRHFHPPELNGRKEMEMHAAIMKKPVNSHEKRLL